MLDTVKLESPPLSEDLACIIERQLVRRQGIDLASGELLYQLTAGTLDGSWDSRVSIRIMRERMVRVPSLMPGEVRYEKKFCAPFVWVEGSTHKAMLGHNIYGGPESLQPACEWLVDDLGGRIGAELPKASSWLLRRADWAETYTLSYEACEGYVWTLNQARFPRRKALRYGEETTAFAGRSTSVNIYHKGPEFSAHDHKRLKLILSRDELESLQKIANETLRVEVQVKAPKLRYDYAGELPRVGDVTEEYLKPVHDQEMRRLVGEGRAMMKKVRKQKDVRDRLHELHEDRLAGLLFGTWMQLAALGEKEVRRHMPKRTFYRHRKQLLDAGVTWIGADVLYVPKASALPQDFQPMRTDPRRVVGEHPTVSAKLAPFRAA